MRISRTGDLLKRIVRFGVALSLLAAIIGLLRAPQWSCVEAFQLNLEQGRDAGGLFYTDVDDIWALISEAEAATIESSNGGSLHEHAAAGSAESVGH